MKYHKLIKNLKVPIIFTCEHASRFIPLNYANLGLKSKELKTAKDLFDPGSLDLAKTLARHFKANLIYPEFSRLVIDANRGLFSHASKNNTYHAAALKTELLIEDKLGERLIFIPGNQSADQAKEEKYRWNKYVKPYFEDIEKLSTQLLKNYGKVYIFQIHSFYPKYKGNVRDVDLGIIHNDLLEAKKIIKSMSSLTDLVVGDNKPWNMEAVSGGLLNDLQQRKGLVVMGLDINNKHLIAKSDFKQINDILVQAISKNI